MSFGWGRKKTDCEWAQPLLSPYLDSQVSAEERRRLEAHLRDCASCSQELASLKLTVTLLNRVPAVPVPRSFTISIPETVRRPVLSPAFFYLRNATAVMAAVFVVLMAGGFALEAWQPVYMTGAPAYRGAEEQIALQQDQGEPTDKAQFGLAPAEDTQQPGHANDTAPAPAPAPAPEPTRAAAAAPLAAAPMATRQESGDAARSIPPKVVPQPAAAPAPTGSGTATAEPPTQPGAAEPASKTVAPFSEPLLAAATPASSTAAGQAVDTAPTGSAPVASYPVRESRTGGSWLWMAQFAVGGLLALLMACTSAIWLRDRRRRGY